MRATTELAAMDKSDDAYRMLPMRVQQYVLDALIRLGRLDMPQPNQQPLLRMSHMGTDKGKQRLAVHSRIAGGHGADAASLRMALLILAPTGFWATWHAYRATKTVIADMQRAAEYGAAERGAHT